MATKVFQTSYLRGELGLPDDSLLVVSDEITGMSRWTADHLLTFKDPADDKFYQVPYSVGATEMHTERPWEYVYAVTATEVEERVFTHTEYVPVDSQIKDVDKMIKEASEQIAAMFCEASYTEEQICERSRAVMANIFGIQDSDRALEHVPVQEQEEAVSNDVYSPTEAVGRTADDIGTLSDFYKFFQKLKNKLDDVFYLNTETTIYELPDTPSPDDTFMIHCEDGTDSVYCLKDLYRMYRENKQNGVNKPLKAIVNEIENEYDMHDMEHSDIDLDEDR
jgi:hypothetical protein